MTCEYNKYRSDWRKKNPEKRYREKRQYYAKNRLKNSANSFELWTSADTELIMAEDRPCDSVLSQRLGRSLQAIQNRRCMLRKTEKLKNLSQ